MEAREVAEVDEGQELRTLLTKLVETVKDGMEGNQKLLANHGEGISANRDAIAAIAELVNQHTRMMELMRGVTLQIWEHCFGPDLPLPNTTTVN